MREVAPWGVSLVLAAAIGAAGCTGPMLRDLQMREAAGAWAFVTVHRDAVRFATVRRGEFADIPFRPEVEGPLDPPAAVAPSALRFAVVAAADELDTGRLEVRLADGGLLLARPDLHVHGYDLCFSADGRRLAFFGEAAGEGGLHVLDIDRNDVIDLPVERGRAPSFHPSGDRIAYEGPDGVFVLDIAGGDARLVAPGAASPAWSPDGRTIACTVGDPGGATARTTYVLIDPEAETARRLLSVAEGARPDRPPVWAPDGSGIAVGVAEDNEDEESRGGYGILYVPLDGAAGRVLVLHAPAGRFAWVERVGGDPATR